MNKSIGERERLLILASSSTGNNVFCTPAIHLIRKHRPQSLIGVVALNSLSAEVFEDNPDINHLYVVNTDRKFNALAAQYDRVICLNVNAIRKLSNIKTTVYLPPVYEPGIPRADQLLEFVAGFLGVQIEQADRQYVMGVVGPTDVLRGSAVMPNDVLIHVHLGLGRTALHGWKFFYRKRAGEDKRLWPLAYYITLGKMLREQVPGGRIIITGTRNENYLARQFEREVGNTINLVGKTTARDIFGMMRHVRLFIAHDCGVLHIAAATGVPIVGIYAPTDPALAGPYPPRPWHNVIKKDQMSSITPEEVMNAAQQLLQSFPGKTG